MHTVGFLLIQLIPTSPSKNIKKELKSGKLTPSPKQNSHGLLGISDCHSNLLNNLSAFNYNYSTVFGPYFASVLK